MATDREIAHALGGAAQRGELRIAVQPVVNLETGAIGGWESLARWVSPGLGEVPPQRFIRTAERHGQIFEIGEWIANRALSWLVDQDPAGVVGVNASAMELDDYTYASRLLGVVHRHGFTPDRLCVEITESRAVRRRTQLATLHELAEAGVNLALDDLGVAHSSVEAMVRLPVNIVKLDRSICSAVGTGVRAESHAEDTVDLCRAHGKRIVAEGVETQHQADFFRALGCDWGQGWYFGHPEVVQDAPFDVSEDNGDSGVSRRARVRESRAVR